jgi:SAM-dependent methyltransferase
MSIAHKVSAWNRERKWKLFLEQMQPTPQMRVLEVGFTDREYTPTDNFIEKNYPYPEMLTALGVEEPVEFPLRYPKVKVVRYNGGEFPFADKEFDICWSNAVIEHVGNRDRQLSFLAEVARVSKRAFVTTPNRYFPIEVHTLTPLLHFLPKDVFDHYLRLVGKGAAAGDYMHLLSIGDMETLLRKCGVGSHKIFKNRLLGFTMDFVAVLN